MLITPPSNLANAVAPFSPLGRSPVGQEERDREPTTFEPVQQLPEAARRDNQREPDERPNDIGERQRLDEARERQQQADDADKQSEQAAKAAEREQNQKQIAELAARDTEVRAHEAAHAAVGGQYAGAPTYQYRRGPDGVSYAVSGEVSIDTSPVPNDPEATLRKAQVIAAAANAPAEPSPQDRRVAAEAARLEVEARAEIVQQQADARAERIEQLEQERAAAMEQKEQQREQDKKADEAERDAERATLDAEDAERRADFARRSIDLSQRLIDIGVNTPSVEPPGSFLDQIA